ncbi:E3 ubiquitin-protein ligase SIRP1 [Dictyocoela muelleri]|nr:E3 ubiquitin-protein ligase SIRP1 [Dictyocoela muelleri]
MTINDQNTFYCHSCNQKMVPINSFCSLCNSDFIELYDPLEHDLDFNDSIEAIIRLLDGLRNNNLQLPSVNQNIRILDVYRNRLVDSLAAMDSIFPHQLNTGIHLKCFKNETKRSCSVCINDINIGEKAVKLLCKHIFHKKCIYRWMRVQKSCPICRKDVE